MEYVYPMMLLRANVTLNPEAQAPSLPKAKMTYAERLDGHSISLPIKGIARLLRIALLAP